VALAQLVLSFVKDPPGAAQELRRVVRPDGIVAACVWDFTGGMRLLRLFWDAAMAVDPEAPDELTSSKFGRDGEIARLFRDAGLRDVASGAIDVEARYDGFDDLWSAFQGHVGPAGVYLASLDAARRAALRDALRARLGTPAGAFTLPARAWYATGRV
jgi:hypothetical protein